VVPACFAVRGQRLYVTIDEKPKRVAGREIKRLRNIVETVAVYDDGDCGVDRSSACASSLPPRGSATRVQHHPPNQGPVLLPLPLATTIAPGLIMRPKKWAAGSAPLKGNGERLDCGRRQRKNVRK
jgi:hypothetical protein